MGGTIKGMTKLLARAMCAAAFLFGSIPMLVLVADVPVAQAKPHGHGHDAGDSGSPDGCVPMGVTKHSDGSVWAVEKCHGQTYYERMTD
jgi:hypothetical protein